MKGRSLGRSRDKVCKVLLLYNIRVIGLLAFSDTFESCVIESWKNMQKNSPFPALNYFHEGLSYLHTPDVQISIRKGTPVSG